MKVLLIEKDRGNADVWGHFLMISDFVGSAVMYDNSNAFGIVMSDHGFEALIVAYTFNTAPNGLEILRQAHQMAHWRGKPLILVTGNPDLDLDFEDEVERIGAVIWGRPVDIEERLADLLKLRDRALSGR